MTLAQSLDALASRRVLLFGGKGGVGKTTVSAAAALHLAQSRPVVLFTTDPASNLADLFSGPIAGLTIESLDADRLYARFLDTNLASFIEVADRGTYLDRDELRRFFELALPGIDELMAWMRIGELAEQDDATVVVDTAPTGHTLRMLSAAEHFAQLAAALDAMQQKHRDMVRQFTRRDVRDAIDAFIDDFESQARRRRELLTNPQQTAFVPVMLSEPWVVEQTRRLIMEVRADGIDVPLALLNRAVVDPDCPRDRERAKADESARNAIGLPVADAPRSCVPLDTIAALESWLQDGARAPSPAASGRPRPAATLRLNDKLLFLAGKGGVGKTTAAASIALQLARAEPANRYVVLSVDPAHSLRDVFAHEPPPPNLAVETIDTREKWRRFRDTFGQEIERAVDSLTPRGLSVAYDTDALRKLVEVAPPGADELFAITRLSDLIADPSLAGIIVDTAPTGHFLRLLDLPRTAGEWVREFMRILLRYRELIPAGSLGEELVSASRALKQLEETLRSEATGVIVVTRPERIVVAETKRLIADVERRGMRLAGVLANYVTPQTDCPCDRSLRAHEDAALAALGRDAVIIERRDAPPTALDEIASLVPLH